MKTNFMIKDMPSFMEKELETISELIKPKLKKSSKYMMFAVPMLSVSIVNLFFMLVLNGYNQQMLLMLGIYAVIGAVGAALFKESRHINKEIRKISVQHMIERINKSEHVNDYMKSKYVQSIKARPKFGMQTFMNFLAEEQQRKQTIMDN